MDILSTGFHLFLVLAALIVWKFSFFPSNSLLANRKSLALWLVFMFACACTVYVTIVKWSSPSVRVDQSEISFNLVFSMIWIALTQGSFAFLGVSLRDDIAERRNPAAAFTAGGLTVAATCCVAASSIGDGPGFEVVLCCAALSTISLLALWAGVAHISGIADAIMIDRDRGTGVRAAGWLAGTGVALGACVAGDWVSYAATLKDFARFGWPVAVATGLFAAMERAANRQTNAARLNLAISIVAAASMTVAGAIYAHWVGQH